MIANNKQEVAKSDEIDLAAEDSTEPVGVEVGLSDNGEKTSLPPQEYCAAVESKAILESLTELHATLTSQGKALAELAQRDALLERLHERLAAYEQDERVRSFLEPLARKAAPIHRRLKEQASHARDAIAGLAKPLRRASPYYWSYRSLEATAAELETLLADFGIETFEADGDLFDRRSQEAVERVAAVDSNNAGEIARRVSPGLRIDERIIVAERVAVYVAPSTRQS